MLLLVLLHNVHGKVGGAQKVVSIEDEADGDGAGETIISFCKVAPHCEVRKAQSIIIVVGGGGKGGGGRGQDKQRHTWECEVECHRVELSDVETREPALSINQHIQSTNTNTQTPFQRYENFFIFLLFFPIHEHVGEFKIK